MKKLVYLFIVLFVGTAGLYAQNCSTGFCPPSITVHHKAGDVSPTGADITYKVVGVPSATPVTCWITTNLGATAEAGNYLDQSASVCGWYWQYSRKQGYESGKGVALPVYLGVQPSGSTWTTATDPCTLLLGTAWHIPSNSEWTAVGGGYAAAYTSIKLAYANQIISSNGAVNGSNYGTYHISGYSTTGIGNGYFWSQNGNGNAYSVVQYGNVADSSMGYPMRCAMTK